MDALPKFSITLGVEENIRTRFVTWLNAYTRTFKGIDDDLDFAVNLKIVHTEKVREIIIALAIDLGLDHRLCRLAESCALFHDVGRFPQIKTYRTFSDRNSANHALLGCKVLQEQRVLEPLDTENSEVIFRSVKLHNLPALPEDEDEAVLFFTRLLRDADKIDILRVVSEHYTNNNGSGKGSIVLDLPESDSVSEDIINAVRKKEKIRYEMLKTVNDFKLLQLSWVYDFNFSNSLEMLSSLGHCEAIMETLPKAGCINEIKAELTSYLRERVTA